MKPCSRCGVYRGTSRKHRYCRACQAAYMRARRRGGKDTYASLSPEQRRRANARSRAGYYLRRGKIERRPCRVCGKRAQMHHPDYRRPLDVEWMCAAHHRAHHRRA